MITRRNLLTGAFALPGMAALLGARSASATADTAPVAQEIGRASCRERV